MTMGRILLVALLALIAGVITTTAAAQEQAPIHVVKVDGPITPVVADEIADAMQRALGDGAQALLVELDTPGGLDESMRSIVQIFLNGPVPVVVYVSPSGGRAASAGAVITLAGHVAAMAPGTTIGAATPVDIEGAEVGDKVVNDAASYAVSIAEERGRNVDFAEDMVRAGISITANQALELGVVDLVAPTRQVLLQQLDDMTVSAGGTEVTLATASAPVVESERGFLRDLLSRLADPAVAYILLSIGILAVLYEVATPGMGLGGIVGVILLVLAFFALAVLPVNIAGIALLILAVALFAAELFVPGVGVLAAGGVTALLLAGVFLFEGSLRLSWAVLVPTALVVGVGVVVAGRVGMRARQRPPESGREALLGRRLVVRRATGTTGQAVFEGAWWTVESRGDALRVGASARVVDVEDLRLIVEPEE
jgi:membrane-bound serine protease (ClpP class)